MSSIKTEPTEGESPLNVSPPLPLSEPINQSTVKCEWSLKGVCACGDGQCEDCQASEKEDEKDNSSLRMTPAAASPINGPENDETEFHPPIWEDCEAAEETGTASDAANEDVKPVLEIFDDNLADRPVIGQVNIAKIKEEINDNVEERIINSIKEEDAEMREKSSQVTVHVNLVSQVALHRSTRVRKSTVNYSVLPEAEEEAPQDDPNTGTSDSEESDSAESAMETDGDPSETTGNFSIAANGSKEHLSRRSFPCRQCGKAFASKQSARLHEDTLHHQIARSRPYVCSAPDCGMTFAFQSYLDKHSLIHSNLRPFTCATCDASFNQKSALKSHQRIHTAERPYACAHCPKAFKWNRGLVRHSLLHSDLKPSFTCADCGGSFTEKSSLKVHRKGKIPCASRYAPSESRPFSCTVEGCGKAFKYRRYLGNHIRTHSGAKEFKCTVCEGAFTLKASLQRHSRNIHGI